MSRPDFRHLDLLTRLRGCAPWEAALQAARTGGGEVNLEGPAGPVRALIAVALAHDLGKPVVVVAPDLGVARELAGDAEQFAGREAVLMLPDRDLAPYEPGPVSPQLAGLRLAALARLPDLTAGVAVTTAAALP